MVTFRVNSELYRKKYKEFGSKQKRNHELCLLCCQAQC